MRRAFQVLLVLGAVLLLVVAGAGIWLRSPSGQRFVLDTIAERSGLEVDATRVSGSLISGITLQNATVRECARGVQVQADRITSRHSLWSFLRGSPRLALTLDRPVVEDVKRPCRGGPGKSRGKAIELTRFVVHDGQMGKLRAIEVDASGRVAEDGTARFRVRNASATSDDGRIVLSGTAGPDGVDLETRMTADDGPLGRTRAEVRVRGPVDAIRVEGKVEPERGEIGLSGVVDAVAGRAELDLRPKGITFVPEVGDADVLLSGQARMTARRDGEDLSFHVRGKGDFRRRVIDPALVDVTSKDGGDAMAKHTREGTGGTWQGEVRARRGKGGDFELELVSPGQPPLLLKGKLPKNGGRPRIEATAAGQES